MRVWSREPRWLTLGRGTGIFTELLVERGFAVTAVEPNESMSSQANVRGAQWVRGTFEASGLGRCFAAVGSRGRRRFIGADPPRKLAGSAPRRLKTKLHFSLSCGTIEWGQESEIVRWTEDAISAACAGIRRGVSENGPGTKFWNRPGTLFF